MRDCLHPADLVPLLDRQLSASLVRSSHGPSTSPADAASAFSLRQLSDWCETRFGRRTGRQRGRAAPVRHSVDGPRLVAGGPGLGLCAHARRKDDHPRGDRPSTPSGTRTGWRYPSPEALRNMSHSASSRRPEPPAAHEALRRDPRARRGGLHRLHRGAPAPGAAPAPHSPRDRSRRRRQHRQDLGDPAGAASPHRRSSSPSQNTGSHGFGRAVVHGLDVSTGDAVVVMMADESDDCRDVVRYWTLLHEGWECVFGSRFVAGGGVIDYPWFKLRINRLANLFIRLLFRVPAQRHDQRVQGLPPDRHRRLPAVLVAPLQPHRGAAAQGRSCAATRGPSIPITWRNRRTGRGQAEDQGDGQPLPLHRPLRLAREVLQPRRLPEKLSGTDDVGARGEF